MTGIDSKNQNINIYIYACVNSVCSVPEVVGSILLTEATSGYEADPRLLQHLHAVKHVRLLTFALTEGKRNIIALFEVSYSGGVALLKHKVLDQ